MQNRRAEYESDRANYLNWEQLKNNDYHFEMNYKANDYWKNKELEENKKKEAWQTAVAYGNYQPLVEMGILSQEAADNAAKSFKLGQKAQDIQNQLIIDNPYGIVKSSGGSGGSKSSSGSSGGRSGGSSGGSSKEMTKLAADQEISHWIYSPYNMDGSAYYYGDMTDANTKDPKYMTFLAKNKLTQNATEIKKLLVSSGYTSAQANSMYNSYLKTVNDKIKKLK